MVLAKTWLIPEFREPWFWSLLSPSNQCFGWLPNKVWFHFLWFWPKTTVS